MYLINGHFRLDAPGEYPYAGTTFSYARDGTTEEIQAVGPISMDIYIKVRAA